MTDQIHFFDLIILNIVEPRLMLRQFVTALAVGFHTGKHAPEKVSGDS
jgi:hypothetical protein